MSRESIVKCTEDGTSYKWKVETLWMIASTLNPTFMPINQFEHELDEDRWYQGYQTPTTRSIIDHFKRVQMADLNYPIILSPKGFILDGTHRLVKAVLENRVDILAVQLKCYPESDY